jgi:hypothetical protein
LEVVCLYYVYYSSCRTDSSTVPNTAYNAKDHGNAPRRFARWVIQRALGKRLGTSQAAATIEHKVSKNISKKKGNKRRTCTNTVK